MSQTLPCRKSGNRVLGPGPEFAAPWSLSLRPLRSLQDCLSDESRRVPSPP